jgi:hypothetical protein
MALMTSSVMQHMRTLSRLAVVAGFLVCLLWPAIYNGGPLLDSDMPGYIRYADAAVAKLTGKPSEWSQRRETQTHSVASPASSNSTAKGPSPFLGRSIYYGALLKLGDVYGMMWPSIALQALALLLATVLTLHHTIGFNFARLGMIVVLLAFATPVAFFASRLMPDMFAGVTILAAANLIVYGTGMSRSCLLLWIALLSMGVLFHSTHILIALSLLALYVLGRVFFRGSASWIGLAALLLCILIGVAGDWVFTIATTRAFGVTPIRLPYLMARVIADGPGATYLRASCPGSGFVVCRFVDRLPVATANLFLFSPDPTEGGVFTPADPDIRRALSAEQLRFAYSVFSYDPLGVTAAAARNVLKQIGMVSMGEFDLNEVDRSAFRQVLPSRYLQAAEKTRSWSDTLPVSTMSVIVLGVLLVSSAYIGSVLVLRVCHFFASNDLEKLTIVIVIGVLVNAIVCAGLSEPWDRFQTRVVWLIPLAAGLLLYQLRSRGLTGTPTTSSAPEGQTPSDTPSI